LKAGAVNEGSIPSIVQLKTVVDIWLESDYNNNIGSDQARRRPDKAWLRNKAEMIWHGQTDKPRLSILCFHMYIIDMQLKTELER